MEATVNKIVTENLVFKGAPESPFLAPRGIWVTDNLLLVADTGQNRVFIWKSLPTQESLAPDLILGQTEATQTARNAGDVVSASTLQYPSGIWSDGERLILADAWNHRVLIWHSFPQADGQPADVVLGQSNFKSNEPNGQKIGAEPTAQTMNWPYGVHSDGHSLWVADTGNRRVLYFEKIPEESFSSADAVIGQQNFEEKDYNNQNPIWPYSVRVNAKGQLAITDTQYYRVLLWNDWKTALHQSADVLIGQADFSANGQNQFSFKPSARSLNWCYDSFFDENGIWVTDTGNSRLLWFENIPSANNQEANDLIGQDDFETGSENPNTVQGTESSLYWPFSICATKKMLAIADTGNHRIILKSK